MQHAHVDFAGMNPGKMQSLIDDLKTAQHTIVGFAGEFSAPLAAQGISTGTVHQAAHWTADQVSRLGERLRELRDQERTTPEVPGGPTSTAPASTTPSATNPGTGGGTTPGGTTPGGTAPGGTTPVGTTPGGTPPAGAGNPGHHGAVPAGAAGAGTAGAGTAGAGAATASGYPGGDGGQAGAATPSVPAPPPPAHAAAAHASAAHPTTAAHQAAQTARHVSQAAQHGQSLPDRVWHDIEHYGSEPQFAAAFLAAVGAAGLTALVASIAESKKKDKQAKEAARRQAMLDELTRSAGEHADSTASPGQRAELRLPWPSSGDAPGHGQAQEADGQPQADGQPEGSPQPQDAPKLSLVAAATGPEEAPAARVPLPSGEN